MNSQEPSFSSRTFTGDDTFSSNTELSNYVTECFWPRIVSCTIRLAYTLRDSVSGHKYGERQWTLQVRIFSSLSLIIFISFS